MPLRMSLPRPGEPSWPGMSNHTVTLFPEACEPKHLSEISPDRGTLPVDQANPISVDPTLQRISRSRKGMSVLRPKDVRSVSTHRVEKPSGVVPRRQGPIRGPRSASPGGVPAHDHPCWPRKIRSGVTSHRIAATSWLFYSAGTSQDRVVATTRTARMPSMALEIGRALRRARLAQGLTLKQLAAASAGRFKPTSVAGYERGERGISVVRFCELSRVYRVPPDRLLTEILRAAQADPELVIDLTHLERLGPAEGGLLSGFVQQVASLRGSGDVD